MNNSGFLHILPDEKFIDNVISYFRTYAPGRNIFLIKGKSDEQLRYGKDIIYLTNPRQSEIINAASESGKFRTVLFHAEIDPEVAAWCSKKNITIVWLSWGADFYPLIRGSFFRLYGAKTRQAISLGFVHYCKMTISSFFSKRRNAFKEFTSEVNYIAPVIKEDYNLIKRNFPWIRAEYIPFSYASVRDIFGTESLGGYPEGNNILVGNSAAATNNHLEIFNKIAHFRLNGRKVIVPLAYGNERYSKIVVQKGSQLLQDKFDPVLDYMSQQDYIKVLSNCGVVVFNHYRQQAMANIIISMCLGLKIYLSRRSPVWSFLVTGQGAIIFATEEIDDEEIFLRDITLEQKERNRKIILDYYGSEKVADRVKAMVNTLN